MLTLAEEKKASIGVIGGTGVYDPALLTDSEEMKVYTPYGPTSDMITVGTYAGKRVAFLPRHGRNHSIPPHNINYRANIWAFMKLGVKFLISPTAVGSLAEELRPGDFVITDQFIDRTGGRPSTFFDGYEVAHISSADPMCPHLRKMILDSCRKLGITHHERGTYVCIDGPRFSTRAESRMFRMWGADVVGMTLFPEAPLAREARLCFANIAMVTDYDSWKEDEAVSNTQVLETMKGNSDNLKKLLQDIIHKMPDAAKRDCDCANSLKNAMM